MSESAGAGHEVIERRRFLKQAAAVAWSVPLILTLEADRSAAQSCIPANTPCDACAGVNCCIRSGETLPCCCSDPNVPDCGGVCRTQAECQALFPGGPSSDPDACFYPGGTGGTTFSGQGGYIVKGKGFRPPR